MIVGLELELVGIRDGVVVWKSDVFFCFFEIGKVEIVLFIR